MYSDEMRREGGGYDNEKRLIAARNYFNQLTQDRSLIFYYANYSNPFSENEQKRYVIVGVARLKEIGEELFYENCSHKTKEKYAGGFLWDRNISSHYPDQGLCLPYHLYYNRPEILEKFIFVPDNPRNFKYGTRLITDDDALDLIERFMEICSILKAEGDQSEDWSARIAWLQSLVAELWRSRGLYPGLAKVMDYLAFNEAIPYFKSEVMAGREKEASVILFKFLDGRIKNIPDLQITKERQRKIIRQWQLKNDDEKVLLKNVLPRFDLNPDQIQRIISDAREGNGIEASLSEIADNPYILSEQFIGDGPDDVITFNKIDHGIFPSPELGGESLADIDDWRRLWALCVERLKREYKHSFLKASRVIHDINHKLSFLPEWKRHQFNERYLVVDEEEITGALTFREFNGEKYIYLKDVFQAERDIEERIRSLANRPDITFKSPVTEKHWHDYLYSANSLLCKQNPQKYEEAIQGQVKVCRRIFSRPVCVLSGAAGTGKTTVIRSIIQAIEKAHGTGTAFQLLAPTGKAADRMREATQKPAATIHSFLAQRDWLNDNLTFKKSGGKKEDGISTYIIDESSMLDLELAATLFRAINWATVQRLILVGDPNQLPPIGRGKVFAEVIDWLQEQKPECLGNLEINLRQMENILNGKGTGILDLADLFIRTASVKDEESVKEGEISHLKTEEAGTKAEQILRRVQEGGDIDRDLRVIYWNDYNDLDQKLTAVIISDMEEDTGSTFDEERPYELWGTAFQKGGRERRPEYQQIISPYRGERFGTDYLNSLLQEKANGYMLAKMGQMGNVTLFDKVIQYRNRPRSNPIWAYNTKVRGTEQIEIYNGELGFVKPHPFDNDKWKGKYFTLKRFQVVFSRKSHYWVGYGSELGKSSKGWWLPAEKVDENLELAYAISVHKAQGSEFERVYFILPAEKKTLLSKEMFYTAVTRSYRHCTILIQEDISPQLRMRRPESSHLININSSIFNFLPLPDELMLLDGWYEEGKIHSTLAKYMVRSKSEVIIANMLFERGIPFKYEVPLFAPDGTFYLPDFTITWHGEDWYWEHLGLIEQEEYRNHWETKRQWYDNNFPGRLVTTEDSGNLSISARETIEKYFLE
ncbi:MAG: ATP-dependent RecD-like DNA helicase [Pelotomaculum sp. PtaU1.Bin035]|nr:MAG: ATP-dependent RecD-like DNA helicase [Pelotomaculum sp. PtaU1.Bin035]